MTEWRRHPAEATPRHPGLDPGSRFFRGRWKKKRDPGSSAGVTRERPTTQIPQTIGSASHAPNTPVTPDSFRGPLRGEGDGQRLQLPPAAR